MTYKQLVSPDFVWDADGTLRVRQLYCPICNEPIIGDAYVDSGKHLKTFSGLRLDCECGSITGRDAVEIVGALLLGLLD